MKITIKPRLTDKGLCISNKIVRKTSLANAEKATLYANDAGLLLLNEALTAWQIIKTVEMLISRERLNKAALAFLEHRIESEARLARTRHTGHHHDRIAGNRKVHMA